MTVGIKMIVGFLRARKEGETERNRSWAETGEGRKGAPSRPSSPPILQSCQLRIERDRSKGEGMMRGRRTEGKGKGRRGAHRGRWRREEAEEFSLSSSPFEERRHGDPAKNLFHSDTEIEGSRGIQSSSSETRRIKCCEPATERKKQGAENERASETRRERVDAMWMGGIDAYVIDVLMEKTGAKKNRSPAGRARKKGKDQRS